MRLGLPDESDPPRSCATNLQVRKAYRRLKHTRPTIASSPRWRKSTRGYPNNGFQIPPRSPSFLGARSRVMVHLSRYHVTIGSPRNDLIPVMTRWNTLRFGYRMKYGSRWISILIQEYIQVFACSITVSIVYNMTTVARFTPYSALLKAAGEYY